MQKYSGRKVNKILQKVLASYKNYYTYTVEIFPETVLITYKYALWKKILSYTCLTICSPVLCFIYGIREVGKMFLEGKEVFSMGYVREEKIVKAVQKEFEYREN